MSELYDAVGSCRQAQHRWQQRQRVISEHIATIITLVQRVREEHPRMGLRKLYTMVGDQLPQGFGRDRFIDIAVAHGLGAQRPVNRRRTTFRGDARKYPNLLIGRTLTNIDQVWVSDQSYYWTGTRFSYLTLVTDLYSRRIVGSLAAPTLHARWCVRALNDALRSRQITPEHCLIHHSDQGSQYLSREYLQALLEFGVSTSTGEIVYENAHAERVNGILKQEYLDCWKITSHASLVRKLHMAVERYNDTRPHGSLDNHSPQQFEAWLQRLAPDERPGMKIWPEQPLRKLSLNVKEPYKL